MKNKLIKKLLQYSLLFGLISILATLLPYFFENYWFFDLFAHFRPYYFWALIFSGSILIAIKKWVPFGFSFLVFGLSLIPSLWIQKFGALEKDLKPNLNIISFNVYTWNDQKQEAVQYIKSQLSKDSKNILFIIEADDKWVEQLKVLEKDLPFQKYYPKNHNFGFAFMTDIEPRSLDISIMDSMGMPALVARLKWSEQQDISFWGIHTLPPIKPDSFDARQEHLSAIAEKIEQDPNLVLVAGDFNLSPWSIHFRDFLASTPSLSRAGQANKISLTWKKWLFQMPIDHILYDSRVMMTDFFVGPIIGSDHRPLHLHLFIPKL